MFGNQNYKLDLIFEIEKFQNFKGTLRQNYNKKKDLNVNVELLTCHCTHK